MSERNRMHPAPSEHEELCQLIPWYLNDTLSESETRRLDDHLESCLVCRSELNFQREIARIVREDDVEKEAVDFNFAGLRNRLSESAVAQARNRQKPTWTASVVNFSRRSGRFRYQTAAIAATVIVAVALSLIWSGSGEDFQDSTEGFQTLSSAGSEDARVGGDIFIAFQQGTEETAISEIFLEYNVEPVARSEDQRLWRIRLADGNNNETALASTVDRLRAIENVLFVEKVISGE